MDVTTAKSDPAAHQATPVVIASMVVGSAALLVLGIEPILLGSLAEAGRLSQAGVGQAAMLETLGIAVGAAVSPGWMNRGGLRFKATLLALALALINLAIPSAQTQALVLLDRAAAGLVAGLLLGGINLIITHGKRAERLSGILLGLSMAPQIVAAYAIPAYLNALLGPAAGFYLLGGGALIAAAAAFALVDKVDVRLTGGDAPTTLTPALVVFAFAMFIQAGGLGAAWNYIERLGHQKGIPPDLLGGAVAVGLAFQVAAAWISSWISWRFPRWNSILLLSAVQVVFLVLALLATSPAMFLVGVSGFGLVAPALQPFQVAGLITLDPARRAAVLTGPIILVGNGMGPLVASFAVTQSDVRGGYWLALAMLVAALAPYALVRWWRRHLSSEQEALSPELHASAPSPH